MERLVVEDTFNGCPNFGRKVTSDLSRVGHVLTGEYNLSITLPKLEELQWTSESIYQMVRNVELEESGCRIDRKYGEYWNALSRMLEHECKWEDKGDYVVVHLPFTFPELVISDFMDARINIEFGTYKQSMLEGSGQKPESAYMLDVQLSSVRTKLDRESLLEKTKQFLVNRRIKQLQFTGEELMKTNLTKLRSGFCGVGKGRVVIVRTNQDRQIASTPIEGVKLHQFSEEGEYVDTYKEINGVWTGYLEIDSFKNNKEEFHVASPADPVGGELVCIFYEIDRTISEKEYYLNSKPDMYKVFQA